jgi:hypothetical protein
MELDLTTFDKYVLKEYLDLFNIELKDKVNITEAKFILYVLKRNEEKICKHKDQFDNFEYLGNIYKYIMELDDVEDFFTDNALFHLKKSTYPSKTVDFLGNNDFIETYFLKNGNLECYEFKLIDNKKIKMD